MMEKDTFLLRLPLVTIVDSDSKIKSAFAGDRVNILNQPVAEQRSQNQKLKILF